MKITTYYDKLKVAPDAPEEIISAAFKVLAKKYHPDVNPDDAGAREMMQVINAARDTLLDPLKRAKYDLWIKRQKSSLLDADDVFKRARLIALKHGIKTNDMKLKRGSYQIKGGTGRSDESTMVIKLEFDFKQINSGLSLDVKTKSG